MNSYERWLIEESKKVLKENSLIAFEIGYDQAEEVSELLDYNGFKNIKIIKDLAGLHRVVLAEFKY